MRMARITLAHHVRHLPGLPGRQEPLVERREVRVRRGPRAHEQGPRTIPRPWILRRPLRLPESHAMGATPARLAADLASRVPSSGMCESSTAEMIGPNRGEHAPGEAISLAPFQRRDLAPHGCGGPRQRSPAPRPCTPASWRRPCRSSPASRWRAHSRARRGFTRSAGSSALNSAASRSRWYDEVASYTTPTTSGPAQRTSARIPRPSFANRRDSPSRTGVRPGAPRRRPPQ